MTQILKPADLKDLTDVVAWAVADEVPLELIGSGSKRAIGHPVDAGHILDLSGLAGVNFYEPEELVLSVKAGTPVTQIRDLLEDQAQMFAFEPPDFGVLLSGRSAQGTIGGMVAAGFSGPRRFKAGGVRDHVLGATAVSGRGEVFVSGGRVVKNVTGYDLPKLLTGSWGTLAALAEVNLKVLPAPEKVYTLLLMGLDETKAVAAMTLAAQSPYEVSGLAHIPTDLTGHSHVSYVSTAGTSVTAIRVEGPDVSVKHRMSALRSRFSGTVSMEELHTMNSDAFWESVRDVHFLSEGNATVWRISVPPAEAPGVVAELHADASFLDAGGGTIWAGFREWQAGQGATVRGAIREGHATLIKAPDETRASEAVFQPQPSPLAALSQRVKDGFDPKGVLNRGRMGS